MPTLTPSPSYGPDRYSIQSKLLIASKHLVVRPLSPHRYECLSGASLSSVNDLLREIGGDYALNLFAQRLLLGGCVVVPFHYDAVCRGQPRGSIGQIESNAQDYANYN